MGGMFWTASAADLTGTVAPQRDMSGEIKQLTEDIQRLKLMNQALWELIRDRARLTDKDLEEKALEIDLRDGKQDGRMSETALRCPSCNRVSSSRHWRCLYCGQHFEKPVMG